MSPDDIRARLEELYDEQQADEWPLAKQKRIREDIDRLEQLLREATWPKL